MWYYNLVPSSVTEKFRLLHKFLCRTFAMRHELWFYLLSWNITSSLIDFMFLKAQYPWRNNKTNGRSSSNIWSVALWEIFSSNISFYCCSAPFSVLSQIWRRQMCLFPERNAVRCRYQYAAFCGEHRFGITITNICVALQQFVRLAKSIRLRCVQNQLV